MEDIKGVDIVLLDVTGQSNVTDYYVMVTGNSPPHLKALTDEVEKVLKGQGVRAFRKSGTPESAWIVMDYIDVVVHLFAPDTRAYYALEELWSDAVRLEA